MLTSLGVGGVCLHPTLYRLFSIIVVFTEECFLDFIFLIIFYFFVTGRNIAMTGVGGKLFDDCLFFLYSMCVRGNCPMNLELYFIQIIFNFTGNWKLPLKINTPIINFKTWRSSNLHASFFDFFLILNYFLNIFYLIC